MKPSQCFVFFNLTSLWSVTRPYWSPPKQWALYLVAELNTILLEIGLRFKSLEISMMRLLSIMAISLELRSLCTEPPPTVGLWLPYKAYMITYQNDSHTVIAKSLAIQWNYWPGLGYSYMVCCGKQESFSTGNSEHGNVMTINHHHNSDGLLSISSNGE